MSRRLKQRCGGIFQPDPDIPPDPLDRSGLRYCLCGLRGIAGDGHHTPPEVDGRDVQQRRIGETG